MSNFNDDERNFIDGVWKKARYLEYKRAEEKQREVQQTTLKKKKFRSLLSFTIGLILITIPLLIIGDFDEGLAAFICVYMMGFALYYEYNFS